MDYQIRLAAIEEACKAEIQNITNEISRMEQTLLEKQNVSGMTIKQKSEHEQKISDSRSQLITINQNSAELDALIKTIRTAQDAVKDWTPGIVAAIKVVELYSQLLKEGGDSNLLIKQSSASLHLLVEDIKNYSLDKGAGERVMSAFQGLGLAIAGFLVSVIAIVITIVMAFSQGKVIGPFGTAKDLFASSFDSFKETWTGQAEPPELKKLSHEIKALNAATQSRYGFYAPKNVEPPTGIIDTPIPPKGPSQQ